MMGISEVQLFISEAQSTADLANASDIVARVARVTVGAVRVAGGELVIPASLDTGAPAPDRIVAPARRGRPCEGAAAHEEDPDLRGRWVKRRWHALPELPSCRHQPYEERKPPSRSPARRPRTPSAAARAAGVGARPRPRRGAGVFRRPAAAARESEMRFRPSGSTSCSSASSPSEVSAEGRTSCPASGTTGGGGSCPGKLRHASPHTAQLSPGMLRTEGWAGQVRAALPPESVMNPGAVSAASQIPRPSPPSPTEAGEAGRRTGPVRPVASSPRGSGGPGGSGTPAPTPSLRAFQDRTDSAEASRASSAG